MKAPVLPFPKVPSQLMSGAGGGQEAALDSAGVVWGTGSLVIILEQAFPPTHFIGGQHDETHDRAELYNVPLSFRSRRKCAWEGHLLLVV